MNTNLQRWIKGGVNMSVAQYIDHTLLKANATVEDVKKICEEAKQYQFAAVCINPTYVSCVKEMLSNTNVKVCTVIGFPLGANTTAVKIFEAEQALKDGAEELDYVVNISDVKNGYYLKVDKEMKAFHDLKETYPDITIKIILENCYLTQGEIKKVCELAKDNELDYVKTSTGFGSGGAEMNDVILMRKTVGEKMGVKASGGVRTFKDAVKYIGAGATRIGTSNGVSIVEQHDSGKIEVNDY